MVIHIAGIAVCRSLYTRFVYGLRGKDSFVEIPVGCRKQYILHNFFNHPEIKIGAYVKSFKRSCYSKLIHGI